MRNTTHPLLYVLAGLLGVEAAVGGTAVGVLTARLAHARRDRLEAIKESVELQAKVDAHDAFERAQFDMLAAELDQADRRRRLGGAA